VGHVPGGNLHAWYVRRAETLPGRVTKELGLKSWHPGSHPPPPVPDALREGRLTRWDFPKLGYSVVRPPMPSYA